MTWPRLLLLCTTLLALALAPASATAGASVTAKTHVGVIDVAAALCIEAASCASLGEYRENRLAEYDGTSDVPHVAGGEGTTGVRINGQKQAGHIPGTPQNKNRIKQGKPTSSFFGEKSGERLTQITHEKGKPVPGRPNVKEHDFGISTGTGPNGGSQTKVRVHQSPKTGEIHGHPSGPERH